MEANRRLLGMGCIGLGLVAATIAAVWQFVPPLVQAAHGDEPAIAPSPPPIRLDIHASREAPRHEAREAPLLPAPRPQSTLPLPAAPRPGVAMLPSATARSMVAPRDEAAPLPPAIRTDIQSHRELPLAMKAPTAAQATPTILESSFTPHEAPTPAIQPQAQPLVAHSDMNRLRPEAAQPIYAATGEPTVSQTALLRASDLQPGGPEMMLDGNLLLVEAHELAETADSIEQFTKIVELCHGGIQAGVGAEAVQFANELTSWAYNRRGEAFDAEGDVNKALIDFNAAVKHHPTRWKAVHNRGVSLAQAGRVREALDDLSRTIQLQPRFAKAYSNRAAISEQQGRFREALIDFQKAAELEPGMPTAHAGMGRALLQLSRHRDALMALDEAVRIDSENPAFLTSRGDVYAALADYESALADYGKAIEVDPTFATAYRNGSWLLATCPDGRFRDEENAVIGAEKALDLAFADRHLCLDTLAAAHANAGEFDRAVEVAQEAIEEAPRGVQAFYQTRLEMYQRQRPFRTQATTQQAAHLQVAQ